MNGWMKQTGTFLEVQQKIQKIQIEGDGEWGIAEGLIMKKSDLRL